MQLAWSIKHDFQRGALFDRFPTGTLEKLRQRRAHSSFAYLTLVSQVGNLPTLQMQRQWHRGNGSVITM